MEAESISQRTDVVVSALIEHAGNVFFQQDEQGGLKLPSETVRKAGQKAMFDADVKGLHPELVKLIGRLKFRYSYGENVLQHSVEVGLVAGILAAQIGADPQIAKTAGFLHDIGKALTHEVDGPHAEIGADIAKRYGQNERVVAGIREHHA